MAVAINGFVYFTMAYGHWKPGKWWILSSVVLWMIRRDDMRAGVQLAGYPYDSKEMPPMMVEAPNSVLNVKALEGTFNQEKALVGAFSLIVHLHRLINLRH